MRAEREVIADAIARIITRPPAIAPGSRFNSRPFDFSQALSPRIHYHLVGSRSSPSDARANYPPIIQLASWWGSRMAWQCRWVGHELEPVGGECVSSTGKSGGKRRNDEVGGGVWGAGCPSGNISPEVG